MRKGYFGASIVLGAAVAATLLIAYGRGGGDAIASTGQPGQVQFFKGEDPGFPAPTGDAAIIDPSSKVMRVWNGGCALTEGVAAGHDGFIYFVDVTFSTLCKSATDKSIRAGDIWKYDPVAGTASIFRSPSGMAAGTKFDRNGNMVNTLGADYGSRMVVRTNTKTGKAEILTAEFEGKAYNAPNDLTIDAKGRIYFSDPRYLGTETVEQPGFAVYRIDPDGAVSRIVTDGGKTNGVAVSPDQKTLYVASKENGVRNVLSSTLGPAEPVATSGLLQAYDLNADGRATNRKVIVNYGSCPAPDGLVTDSLGNLYIAESCGTRHGIAVRDPFGKEIGFISTGDVGPTNVGFGRGQEADVLYVTAGVGLYKIKLKSKGYQLS